jgi:two-component system, chemotaxis family, chemotaxis protein CheY
MSGQPRTCLVVDDSRVVRKVARRILEGRGFAVTEAENGAVAIELCRAGLPQCVLLDWNMPVMNGLGFLHAARREFGPDEPVIVFCTTENEESCIRAALEGGAQEYIMKPFDEALLVDKFAQAGLL